MPYRLPNPSPRLPVRPPEGVWTALCVLAALLLAAPALGDGRTERSVPTADDAAARAASPPPAEAGRSTPSSGPIFEELEGSGFSFHHFNGMSGRFYMAEINSGGGGLIDYDGDGDLDLYLVQGAMLGDVPISEATFPPAEPLPLRDRLFRNDLEVRPDGTRVLRFTDVTEASGIRATGYGFGVASGDFDNDGWPDLYVTQLGGNLLLRNNGDGTFTDVTATSGADDPRWSMAASLADYDADGWLDLLVGNYLDYRLADNKVCRTASGARDYCGPSAYPGVTDRLLRNRGDGSFEDVTVAAGLGGDPTKTLGVVAADLNGDGRVDFYVASDLTPNRMWIQGAGGKFRDEALLAGSAVNREGKAEASMGVDAGDFDNDGDDDLFMTHLVGETNTLFVNDGAGMFEDGSADSGLGVPSWGHTAWGAAWIDYDNDGLLEVMVANGAVRVVEALADAGDPFPFHETNQLFHNLGGSPGKVRFEEVTAAAGPAFARSEVSRALAFGDLDNDGDTDALLVNNNGPARILLNRVGQDRRWLGLRLVGGPGGRDLLGATATLLRDGRPALRRRARTDGSFGAANDPRVLFGLGDDARPATVRVEWPDGSVEEWPRLETGRYHTLVAGSGKAVE